MHVCVCFGQLWNVLVVQVVIYSFCWIIRANCSEKMEQFLKRCFYHSGQYDSQEDFEELDKKLKEHEVICALAAFDRKLMVILPKGFLIYFRWKLKQNMACWLCFLAYLSLIGVSIFYVEIITIAFLYFLFLFLFWLFLCILPMY